MGHNHPVHTGVVSRSAAAAVGILSGAAALAASYWCSALLGVREWPLVALAEAVVALTPGATIEFAIRTLGSADKPVLLTLVVATCTLLTAIAGIGWAQRPMRGAAIWLVIGAVTALATWVATEGRWLALVPTVVALAVAVASCSVLLRSRPAGADAAATGTEAAVDRRTLLRTAGAIGVGAALTAAAGHFVSAGRRQVENARLLLRLPGVTNPRVPAHVHVSDLPGLTPWRTPNSDFYVIDTSVSTPAIDVREWRLRVHGAVDRELEFTFDDLLARQLTESWITINCVSNTVGGDLIGNAWWSGVRVRDLLAEAGVQAGADACLQTSHDGWTCLTPLEALTDERPALLAVAMNGVPLPLEHGFPVRTVVPGLYGYVSACKWVVDLKVTTFADDAGYWTDKGWSALGPVKIGSRIDVPADGAEVASGPVRIGGLAWDQNVGIKEVEIALDGGAWQPADVTPTPNHHTWAQWTATLDLTPGEHQLRVRAIGLDGQIQTGARAEPAPDGATGWHQVRFTANAG